MTEITSRAQSSGVEAIDANQPFGVDERFRRLFDQEFLFVCRLLVRLGVRAGDVEDVAQELFLAVLRNWGAFQSGQSERAWLAGYATRFAANYRRLARHRTASLEHEPAGKSGDLEAREIILKALDVLDFDKRTVLILHDFEGFEAQEVAREVGIPVNTVYSRLRHARIEFREAFATLGKERGS